MSRRRRIVGFGIAGLVTVAAILVLAVHLTSPPAFDTSSVESKEIPTAWRAASPTSPPASEASAPEDSSPVHDESFPAPSSPFSFYAHGSLIAESDGRAFATESYELELGTGGLNLISRGSFSFKVVLATIRMTFDQELTGTSNAALISYRFDLEAPLGFDQSITARIEDGRLRGTRNDRPLDIAVESDDPFIVGSFSTYAVLPARLASRNLTEESYALIFFGGRPEAAASDASEPLPRMEITRVEPITLAADGTVLTVDRYIIESAMGETVMLAAGPEFLALFSEEDPNGFRVYRSDYFPHGFELLPPPETLPSGI